MNMMHGVHLVLRSKCQASAMRHWSHCIKLLALLATLISLSQIGSCNSTRKLTIASKSQIKHHKLERKAIVFDLKTPKVFYCPQEKPDDLEKLIVKARPLERLCEFEGAPKPRGKPSDCYDDLDETEYACDEKRRFMIKLDLAGEGLETTEGIDDLEYILAKNSGKKVTNKKKTKY